MVNKPNHDNLDNQPDGFERNDFDNPALLEAGKRIKRVQFPAQAASAEFEQRLKAEILQKRHKGKTMKTSFNLLALFKVRRLVPAVAVVLVIAIVFGLTYFWPGGPGGQSPKIPLTNFTFSDFSDLIISPAYADDNFEVEPTHQDSLGVEDQTAFIIKSKDKVDAKILEKNISLAPTAEFDFEKINDYEFRVTPKNPLGQRQIYNLKIASAYINENGIITERDYSWAFQVKDQFKILNTLPRDQVNSVPIDTGIEITFSHEKFFDYEKAFSIEPAVKGRFEKHKRTLVFVPDSLAAGTVYTITIDKDIKVAGSQEILDKDFVFQFETSASGDQRGRGWNFGFYDSYSSFAVDFEPFFQVHNYNTSQSSFPVTVYTFSSQDKFINVIQGLNKIPYWASYNRSTYAYNTSQLEEVATYDLGITEIQYSKYLALPETLPHGYYLLETKIQNKIVQTFFQVTDLSIYATVSVTDSLVWVNNAQTQSPVNGAKVEAINNDLSLITNQQGIVTFATDRLGNFNDRINQERHYLKISTPEQSGIFPLDVDANILRPYSKDKNRSVTADHWYYFYTDRGLYQPNDKINFWGFIKSRDNESIGKVQIKLINSRYRNYYYESIALSEIEVGLDQGNAFLGSLDLENVKPGYYTLQLLVDDNIVTTKYVSVQTYVKPAYKIDITPEKKAIFAGEDNLITLKAGFFEGTPVVDLDLSYNSRLNYNENIGKGEVKTNETGQAEFNIDTVYKECSLVDFHKNYNCNYPKILAINANPTKPEEGEINGSGRVRVFGSRIDAKVKFEKINDSKANILITANYINLDKINNNEEALYGDYIGDLAAGMPVKAEVMEVRYDKVETGEYYDFINKIVRKKYRYNRIETSLFEYDGETDKNGEHKYKVDANFERGKSYYVRMQVGDNQGRHDFETGYLRYHYRYSPYSYDYDSYNLRFKGKNKTEVAEFSIDQKVELEFVNRDELLPSNQGKFLYLKLQRGLIENQLTDSSEYSFNFKNEYAPNIYVKGVWFNGRVYHESRDNGWLSRGGTLVKFKKDDRLLNIEVKTDKDKYVPGEDVNLEVTVTDQEGRPVEANVNLNLVDEAFYELREETVSTLANLYRSVSSGQLTSYKSHKEVALSLDAAEGGGCFVAGTQIAMADNSTKNIEQVQVGEQILTFANEYGDKLVPGTVVARFEHIVDQYLIINNHLKVTPEHRMFINQGWMMVGEAKVGDFLLSREDGYIRINNIEKVNEIVKVYNLHVENYHTYIANDIYVHNDKGGPREDFVDTALFNAVQTDRRGKAEVKFTLPDNITSWRITSQAISNDLEAGNSTTNILVSLPIFAESTFANDYLTSDKPIIKMRAFGEDLDRGEKVIFEVDIPSLGVDKVKQSGQAFEPSYLEMSQLQEGIHKVSVGVTRGEDQDIITKPIKISKSRLKVGQQNFYTLTEDLTVEGSKDDSTLLIFSDKNQGQLYNQLRYLSWTYGDRVDQKLARVLSGELKEKYFAEEIYYPEKFQGSLYQQDDGGISLLPYSDSEFELSAKVAALAENHFDQESLAGYFYEIINNRNSNREEIATALFALASLKEPVLLLIQDFAWLSDLTVKEKLYIALAAYYVGDEELAREFYIGVIQNYGEDLDYYYRINTGDDQDDILSMTALASILAGGLDDWRHPQLWNYIKENRTKDILLKMEELSYISAVLPNLRPGAVDFTVIVGDKEIQKSLKKGKTFHLSVSSDELASLKFKGISGEVGLMSWYEMPTTINRSETSSLVSVRREYYVNGQKTNNLSANDLVEVRIYPEIDANAPDSFYQVNDFLPSGLKILTKTYSRGIQWNCNYNYPYEINGQSIKFSVFKNSGRYNKCGLHFKYYTRVVSPGQYTAEPVVIQSLKSAVIKNYSESSSITIEK